MLIRNVIINDDTYVLLPEAIESEGQCYALQFDALSFDTLEPNGPRLNGECHVTFH